MPGSVAPLWIPASSNASPERQQVKAAGGESLHPRDFLALLWPLQALRESIKRGSAFSVSLSEK